MQDLYTTAEHSVGEAAHEIVRTTIKTSKERGKGKGKGQGRIQKNEKKRKSAPLPVGQ